MLGITTPRYDIGKDAAGHLDGDLDCSGDEKTSVADDNDTDDAH